MSETHPPFGYARLEDTDLGRNLKAAHDDTVTKARQVADLVATVPDLAEEAGAIAGAAAAAGWVAGSTLTAPYTLQPGDRNRILSVDSPVMVAVTVPAGLGPFACLIRQVGAGQVYLTWAAPVEVDAPTGRGTAGPGSFANLIGVGEDTYSFIGGAYATPPGGPVILGGGTFSVREGVAGAYVGYVAFGGPDVVLSIDPPFAISSDTGTITTAQAVDYEATPVLTPTITATNPAGTVSDTVTVNVIDVPPANIIPNQRFAVRDSAPVGTVIGRLLADAAVTGWTLSGGPFAAAADGTVTVTGALSETGTPQYTLTAGANGTEGPSAPQPVLIDVIAAAAIYDPGAAGATVYWDMADTAHRAVSGSPPAFDNLSNVLSGVYQLVPSATPATVPKPLLGTGAAGIAGVDAMVIAGQSRLEAPTGSLIKSLSRNRPQIVIEGVLSLDESLPCEILRMTTSSSTTAGRFAFRIDTSAGFPQLQLVVRRLDTDAVATLTHSSEIFRQSPHYFYAEFNPAAGTAMLALDGVEQAFTTAFASGLGNTMDAVSNAVFLGYSVGVLGYCRISKMAVYGAKPADAARIRNSAVLRTAFGIAG